MSSVSFRADVEFAVSCRNRVDDELKRIERYLYRTSADQVRSARGPARDDVIKWKRQLEALRRALMPDGEFRFSFQNKYLSQVSGGDVISADNWLAGEMPADWYSWSMWDRKDRRDALRLEAVKPDDGSVIRGFARVCAKREASAEAIQVAYCRSRIDEAAAEAAEDGRVVYFATFTASDAIRFCKSGKLKQSWRVARSGEPGGYYKPMSLTDQQDVLQAELNRFRERVAKRMYASQGRKEHGGRAKLGDVLEYCRVFELGPKRGRLHMHVALIFDPKAMPESWLTEWGIKADHKRIVPVQPELSNMWEIGRAEVMPFRTSPGDVFGQIGWPWPRKVRGDQAVLPVNAFGGAQALGAYLGKYLTKQAAGLKNRRRMACSRSFGTKALRAWFDAVAETAAGMKRLRSLASGACPNAYYVDEYCAFPRAIVKRIASEVWMRRAWEAHPQWMRKLVWYRDRRKPGREHFEVYKAAHERMEELRGDRFDEVTGEVYGEALEGPMIRVEGTLEASLAYNARFKRVGTVAEQLGAWSAVVDRFPALRESAAMTVQCVQERSVCAFEDVMWPDVLRESPAGMAASGDTNVYRIATKISGEEDLAPHLRVC